MFSITISALNKVANLALPKQTDGTEELASLDITKRKAPSSQTVVPKHSADKAAIRLKA